MVRPGRRRSLPHPVNLRVRQHHFVRPEDRHGDDPLHPTPTTGGTPREEDRDDLPPHPAGCPRPDPQAGRHPLRAGLPASRAGPVRGLHGLPHRERVPDVALHLERLLPGHEVRGAGQLPPSAGRPAVRAGLPEHRRPAGRGDRGDHGHGPVPRRGHDPAEAAGQQPPPVRPLHPQHPLRGRDRGDLLRRLRPEQRPAERQPAGGVPGHLAAGLAGRPEAGALLGRDGHGLAVAGLLHGPLHVVHGEHPGGAVRGELPRRGLRRTAVLLPHPAADLAEPADLADLLRDERGQPQLRAGPRDDRRRPGRLLRGAAQLHVQAGVHQLVLRLRHGHRCRHLRVLVPRVAAGEPCDAARALQF